MLQILYVPRTQVDRDAAKSGTSTRRTEEWLYQSGRQHHHVLGVGDPLVLEHPLIPSHTRHHGKRHMSVCGSLCVRYDCTSEQFPRIRFSSHRIDGRERGRLEEVDKVYLGTTARLKDCSDDGRRCFLFVLCLSRLLSW